MEPLLCPKEVAAALGVHERTATRLLTRGTLPGFRLGRRWRNTTSHVNDYTEREIAAGLPRRIAA